MTSDGADEAEHQILDVLSEETGPMMPRQVIDQLKEAGWDDAIIREALWRLIDRKEVRLTADRKIEAAQAV